MNVEVVNTDTKVVITATDEELMALEGALALVLNNDAMTGALSNAGSRAIRTLFLAL